MRHAVAGLLNASHAVVDYPLDAAGVIAMTEEALASGDAVLVETVKDRLAVWNERGADLGMNGPTGETVASGPAAAPESMVLSGEAAPVATPEDDGHGRNARALPRGIDLGPVLAQAHGFDAGIGRAERLGTVPQGGGRPQLFDEDGGVLVDRDETRLLHSLNVAMADLLEVRDQGDGRGADANGKGNATGEGEAMPPRGGRDLGRGHAGGLETGGAGNAAVTQDPPGKARVQWHARHAGGAWAGR